MLDSNIIFQQCEKFSGTWTRRTGEGPQVQGQATEQKGTVHLLVTYDFVRSWIWLFSSGLHSLQILESKGDIGTFAHPKPQVTAPKEFHFSTDARLGPPSVADLFDKVVI